LPGHQLYVLLTRKLFGEANPEELQQWEEVLSGNNELQTLYELLSAHWQAIPPVEQKDAMADAHFDYIFQSAADTNIIAMENTDNYPLPRKRNITSSISFSPVISVTVSPENIPGNELKEPVPVNEKLIFEGTSFHELADKMEQWFITRFRNDKTAGHHFQGVFEMKILKRQYS
jgi:hypothetical protein